MIKSIRAIGSPQNPRTMIFFHLYGSNYNSKCIVLLDELKIHSIRYYGANATRRCAMPSNTLIKFWMAVPAVECSFTVPEIPSVGQSIMYEYAIGFKPMHLRSHPGGVNRSVISIADEIADRGGGATVGEMVKQGLESKFLYGLTTMGKRQKTRCPHKWCWRKGIHVKGIAPQQSPFSYHARFGERFKDRGSADSFWHLPLGIFPYREASESRQTGATYWQLNPPEVSSAPLAGHPT
jgi:hypothetical protein